MNKKFLFPAVSIVALLAFLNFDTGKKIIFTKDAPQPIGPYSQGILVGNTLYLAGQVGLDPVTGKLDSTGIAEETRQAMKNLQAVLKAAGMDLSNVVKTTIYLKNVKDFDKVNKEYATFFTSAPPARETVGIADLPKGAHIEISMIAMK